MKESLVYTVTVRGPVVADIARRVVQAHAEALKTSRRGR